MTDIDPEPGTRRHAELVGALTDLALATETVLMAGAVIRQHAVRHRSGQAWWALLFAASAAAAAAGAVHHAIPPTAPKPRRASWQATTAALTAASLAAWQVAIHLGLEPRHRAPAAVVATTAHLAQLAVLTDDTPYAAILGGQVPGVVAMGAAFGSRLADPADRGAAGLGLAAVAGTGVAAAIHVRKLSLHPRWFDYNATYHLAQGLALAVLGASARRFLDGPPGAIVGGHGGTA